MYIELFDKNNINCFYIMIWWYGNTFMIFVLFVLKKYNCCHRYGYIACHVYGWNLLIVHFLLMLGASQVIQQITLWPTSKSLDESSINLAVIKIEHSERSYRIFTSMCIGGRDGLNDLTVVAKTSPHAFNPDRSRSVTKSLFKCEYKCIIDILYLYVLL